MSEEQNNSMATILEPEMLDVITSDNPVSVLKAINAVMADFGAIQKDQVPKDNDKGLKYKYRGIDQFMQRAQPLFVKHKLVILPSVRVAAYDEAISKYGGALNYTRSIIAFRFFAVEDGEWIEAQVLGEAMDSGDKGSNKAMSIALKYCLIHVFMVPTEEPDEDPDNTVHDLQPSRRHPTKQTDRAPYTPPPEKKDIVSADDWTEMRSIAKGNGWPAAYLTKWIGERKAAKKSDREVVTEGLLFFSRPCEGQVE